MSHQFPHLNFPIGEVPILSNFFGLDVTGAGLNLLSLDYYQSFIERHPNLVLKSVYLMDLDDVYPFNIIGLYGVK